MSNVVVYGDLTEDDKKIVARKAAVDLLPYVGLLGLFPNSDLSPENMVTNGSLSLLNTGERKIGVTCAHVLDAFKEMRETNSDAKLILLAAGANVRDFSDCQIIDTSNSLDISTLAIDNPEAIEAMGKRFFDCKPFPPMAPTENDSTAAVGFAGFAIVPVAGGMKASFGVLLDNVTSVNDRLIHVIDENSGRRFIQLDPDISEVKSYGGMSGCAVYRVADGGIYQLIGFLINSLESTDDFESKIVSENIHAPLLIARATYLQADGTFNRAEMRPLNLD